MKHTNLFAEWRHGNHPGPKIYLIRVYYFDLKGVPNTCLKLGFTKQPLNKRIVNFLGAMRKATGITITNYEVLSIFHTENYSQIEYALHQRADHHYFYSLNDVRMCFKGYTEVLRDTTENIDLLHYSDTHFYNGELIRPYNPRVTTLAEVLHYDNVV